MISRYLGRASGVAFGLLATFFMLGYTNAQFHDDPHDDRGHSHGEIPGSGLDFLQEKGAAKSAVVDEAIAKIREEGLNRSKVMDTVLYLTDVIGPRLTNSPGMKRANEWTAKKLTEFGLENAALEPWGPFGTGWTLKSFTAQVTEPVCIPLIGLPKAWSPGTGGKVSGPVIHLTATDEKGLDEYKGKLKGAIVLVGTPREVKALFEAPGKRHTPEELLKLANAPEPAAGGGGRGGFPQSKAARKDEPKKDEPKKDEPAKNEAGKDEAKKKADDVIARTRSQNSFPGRRLQFLIDEGAAVMVETSFKGDGGTFFVQSATVPQPASPGSGEGPGRQAPRKNAYDKDTPKTLPQVVVTVEHFNRLAHMLKAGEMVKAEFEIAAELQDKDLMGYNTVAEIPGTDLKDEVVMLGGHMDSWHGGTGATDNAAGCAVGMEAVRIIKALNLKPRRTIRIALWSGEEQGLHGSRQYVKKHFGAVEGATDSFFGPSAAPDAPLVKTPEYDKFQAYFNMDNGSGKFRGVYLQGNEAARTVFRKWFQPFGDLDCSTITASNTSGTDHLSFDGIGLPGFQFIQDEIEYSPRTHHSNMDVYDRLQADDLKQASTVMAAMIWNAANMEGKFPRKPMRRPILTEEEAKARKSESPAKKADNAAGD
jgi:hypothetical protein